MINEQRTTSRYKEGKMHGKGQFWWSTGNMYEGEYRNGKRNGRGVLRWATGDVYDGEYVDQWGGGCTHQMEANVIPRSGDILHFLYDVYLYVCSYV